MIARLMLLPLLLTLWTPAGAKEVTIQTDSARRDVVGDYVDAHDGKIVEHKGTYFLYGEAYGNQTLANPYPWKHWPRLKVYTSPDLVHWTFRGDPLPMIPGTLWIPNVVFVEKMQTFVMWFGSGGWQTATSKDGINFTPSGKGVFFSRFGAKGRTDGTGLFVDDDGTGYVAFASMPPGFDEPGNPGWPGHDAHGYGHIVVSARHRSPPPATPRHPSPLLPRSERAIACRASRSFLTTCSRQQRSTLRVFSQTISSSHRPSSSATVSTT